MLTYLDERAYNYTIMIYLSQLLNKSVYFQGKRFGKIIDFAIFENSPQAPISKVEIQTKKNRITVSPHALTQQNNQYVLTDQNSPQLPYDHKDFYLAEDLLDKQVIDVDGKRLVRVNDVLIDNTAELKVAGIDVGFAGILRRLGAFSFGKSSKIIPWQFIEAFDYQTGTIKIKVAQNNLNTLHASELADILEDVGSKERLGIVAALDAKKAARAIEETDNETQISILEELPVTTFKDVLNKMHVSELADVLDYLNPLRTQEIESALDSDKAQKIRRLLKFADDTAGGLMRVPFFAVDKKITVKEIHKMLESQSFIPEGIIVTNGNEKVIGTVHTTDLLNLDKLTLMEDAIKDRQFVHVDERLPEIFTLFSQYNLRVLPVVDADKKGVGVILIDDVLKAIEEEDERDEPI